MKMKLLFISPLLFCCLLDHGASGVDIDAVLLMEGESVTLHTGVETNPQDRFRWYFNDTRIAQITGDLRKICTDVQCNKGTERFRDRLKLDHQTGSLTIMNITNTDSGDYKLKISSKKNNESIKSFIFAVHGVFAAERNEMKRKSVTEGESVALDPCEVKNPNDLMTWYFNSMYMAKVNRDLSYICTDNQCTERFRDRLKLDHQTGSLTIMNIRTTDSGLYQLQINSSRFSITRSFSVTVFGVTVTGGSDPRPASAAEICAAVIGSVIVGALLVAGVIYCLYRKSTQATQDGAAEPHSDQQNGIQKQDGMASEPVLGRSLSTDDGTSPNHDGASSGANGTLELHHLNNSTEREHNEKEDEK
ncbi:uncharacterized protein LOC127987083 [Carassius gibelio]|uniref:uncharacterized protein LOC127987083 n=1 Tax=Carassius gibelio TaxID=101364 RepID=UPI00227882EF|nr:uncharacterized protein LOC127987083 [Carassius gibelio]